MANYGLVINNEYGVTVFDTTFLNRVVIFEKGVANKGGVNNISLKAGGFETIYSHWVDGYYADRTSNQFLIEPSIFVKLPVGVKINHFDCYGCGIPNGYRHYIGTNVNTTLEYIKIGPLVNIPVSTTTNFISNASHLKDSGIPISTTTHRFLEAQNSGNIKGFPEDQGAYGIEVYNNDGVLSYTSNIKQANIVEHVDLSVFTETNPSLNVIDVNLTKTNTYINISNIGIISEYSGYSKVVAVHRVSDMLYRFYFIIYNDLFPLYSSRGETWKLLNNSYEYATHKYSQFIYHEEY